MRWKGAWREKEIRKFLNNFFPRLRLDKLDRILEDWKRWRMGKPSNFGDFYRAFEKLEKTQKLKVKVNFSNYTYQLTPKFVFYIYLYLCDVRPWKSKKNRRFSPDRISKKIDALKARNSDFSKFMIQTEPKGDYWDSKLAKGLDQLEVYGVEGQKEKFVNICQDFVYCLLPWLKIEKSEIKDEKKLKRIREIANDYLKKREIQKLYEKGKSSREIQRKFGIPSEIVNAIYPHLKVRREDNRILKFCGDCSFYRICRLKFFPVRNKLCKLLEENKEITLRELQRRLKISKEKILELVSLLPFETEIINKPRNQKLIRALTDMVKYYY